ncbi:iccG, partial [Symbiodinium microadriaticum]
MRTEPFLQLPSSETAMESGDLSPALGASFLGLLAVTLGALLAAWIAIRRAARLRREGSAVQLLSRLPHGPCKVLSGFLDLPQLEVLAEVRPALRAAFESLVLGRAMRQRGFSAFRVHEKLQATCRELRLCEASFVWTLAPEPRPSLTPLPPAMAQISTEFLLPNGVKMKNRLSKAAMTEHMADPSTNLPNDMHLEAYKAWSDGGLGMNISGNVQVDRRYLEAPRNVSLEKDTPLEMFQKWAASSKRDGCLAIMQISHAGRQCPSSVCSEPLCPSRIPLKVPGVPSFLASFMVRTPREMTIAEIEEVVERFATTAQRAEEAGWDGVQIHSAHGYLLSSFLSPHTNRRTDAYGGSLENRRSLLLKIVETIRSRVSSSFVVMVKLNSADFQRGGFSEEESLQVLKALEDTKSIDMVEISGGTYEKMEAMQTVKESTRQREAFFLDFAKKARDSTSIPLMLTGGFSSVKAWPQKPGIQRRSQGIRPWPSPGKAAKIGGRIAFVDFWPGFEENTDRWFCKDWFRANLPGVEVVEAHERPDVVMCSLFGRSRLRYLQYGSTAKLVFFTGENVRPPVGRVPLCISFDHMEEVPPTVHMRIPLWIFNKEVHDVLEIHEARRSSNLNSTVHKRAGFCSWVASNATMYNAEFRTRFVQILSSRYHKVACGGEVMNNVGGPIKDKMEFLRGYRFNICFENASHPGYCTEKLLHAFASESIPIYWGDPSCSGKGTGTSDFNTDAFISAHDFEDTAQLIKYIARVDQDPVLFESYLRQPILSESWYRRLKDWTAMNEALSSGAVDVIGLARPLGTEACGPRMLLQGELDTLKRHAPVIGIRYIDNSLGAALNNLWHGAHIHNLGKGLPVKPAKLNPSLWKMILLDMTFVYVWDPKRNPSKTRCLLALLCFAVLAAT